MLLIRRRRWMGRRLMRCGNDIADGNGGVDVDETLNVVPIGEFLGALPPCVTFTPSRRQPNRR